MNSDNVFISDTSVLIDLERGALIEPSFRLPFEFVAPRGLYQLELKEHFGPELITLGLKVKRLSDYGIELADSYLHDDSSLSLPDRHSVAMAKVNSWTILTGDRRLRELAEDEGVSCHGVLWMLDQMFEHEVVSKKDLCDGLTQIANHKRCRLPQLEVRKRLIFYCGV